MIPRTAARAAARGNKASDARGFGRLAIEATVGLTSLVESMHHNISRVPAPLGVALRGPMGGISGLVYRSIRGVTRAVGGAVDLLLAQLEPLLRNEPSSAKREAVLAALNGVLGDHLARTRNPLAIATRLRRGGVALETTREALAKSIPRPAPRLVVLVHGLCLNDLQWNRKGHDHGRALAGDADPTRPVTEIYLHYNSGRPVADSGRELADLLDALVRAWPVPVEEIAMIGHSMGGLVMRAAWARAATSRQPWFGLVRTAIFLGTPHRGAPLERGGHWIGRLLDASPYTTAFSRLGNLRSAGIKDLRHGMSEPLPPGPSCHAIAATIARQDGSIEERWVGDGLVPLESALGLQAAANGRDLFSPARRSIAYGVNHLALLSSRKVYARIRRILEPGAQPGSRVAALQRVGGQG